MPRRAVVIASILFATMWCSWAAGVLVSGTVVDTSGAGIAGATVLVQSANGAIQKNTQSDASGSFSISGLPPGDYRLVVSHADFETKEIPVTIGTTQGTTRCASLWL
ncbi:MAG: carboxypeptidase-like regulatory domain-containing protein [Bryobacteraceae bacterium]